MRKFPRAAGSLSLVDGRWKRTGLGLAVVAASLAVAVSLAGIGFASAASSSAQYEYGKVTICHHAGKKKTVTITISQNAWKAHQKHGDTMGACKGDDGKPKHDGGDDDHGKTSTTPTTTTPSQGDDGHGHDNGKGDGEHGHGHGK